MQFQFISRPLLVSFWPDMLLLNSPRVLTIGIAGRRDLSEPYERTLFALFIEARIRTPRFYLDCKPVPAPWWRRIEVHVASDILEILRREAPKALA